MPRASPPGLGFHDSSCGFCPFPADWVFFLRRTLIFTVFDAPAYISDGGTSTVTENLKPGTYTFYCSVDGHEAAGMKGTLTVK